MKAMIFQFRVDMFLRQNNEKTTSYFIMCLCVYLKYMHIHNKSKTNGFLYLISSVIVLLKYVVFSTFMHGDYYIIQCNVTLPYKALKRKIHCYWCTKTVPRWTFMGPYKSDVTRCPGGVSVSESATNGHCGFTLLSKCHNQYKKRLLLRCIHNFKSDWTINMDHMRISGTELSSVILGQTIKSNFKSWKGMSKKCQNKSWSQKGWCNKPSKLQFQ